MTLRFAKYHGLGNDFVLVDGPLIDAARAIRICDRRRGVGADGVVTILPPRSPGAVATMHIYNPDGSVAEMCGNAIRCLAVHLAVTRGAPDAQVIDTDENAIRGLFAAGELVGGLFYFNYPGGTGLMAGAVFGKIAGASAARSAKHHGN